MSSSIKKIKKKSSHPNTKKNTYDNIKKSKDPYAKARGDSPMTIVDHLSEFRSRILVILIIFTIFTVFGFISLSEPLYNFLTAPFTKTGNNLHGFKISTGFMIRFKISMLAAFLSTLPIILFQLWQYIKPAINLNDRIFIKILIGSSIILFYGGIAFTLFYLIPFSVPILLEFFTKNMKIIIDVENYFNLLLSFSLWMAVFFELPIIVTILTKIGILTPKFMIKYRRHAIVIIVIIAGVITPADVWSQIMVAVPLMALYEASILLSKMISHKK